MFDKKRALVCMICLYVVGVFSGFPVLAAPTTLTPFTVISPMALIAGVILTVVYVRIKKREKAEQEQAEFGNVDKALKNTYDTLNLKDCAELGTVKLVRENITFSATGKYVLAKDFNGQSGYHLAVEIRGTELVSAPDDYNDTLDYASNLLRINLGYFDGVALSTPENDNGMVFKTDALQGKKIAVSPNAGYICDIDTVETDEIDCGSIEISEWSETKRIIAFKLLVAFGVADVVCGKLELLPDPDFAPAE